MGFMNIVFMKINVFDSLEGKGDGPNNSGFVVIVNGRQWQSERCL
jgi:hypothetical protein